MHIMNRVQLHEERMHQCRNSETKLHFFFIPIAVETENLKRDIEIQIAVSVSSKNSLFIKGNVCSCDLFGDSFRFLLLIQCDKTVIVCCSSNMNGIGFIFLCSRVNGFMSKIFHNKNYSSSWYWFLDVDECLWMNLWLFYSLKKSLCGKFFPSNVTVSLSFIVLVQKYSYEL